MRDDECVQACTYVYMYVCMYVCKYVCMYVYVCTCMYLGKYACICVCASIIHISGALHHESWHRDLSPLAFVPPLILLYIMRLICITNKQLEWNGKDCASINRYHELKRYLYLYLYLF